MTKGIEHLTLDETTTKNLMSWLEGEYDHETKEIIHQLIQDSPEEVIDSFYTTLAFGTGGLRGVMGVGTNRINQYTVRAATQGLANYLAKQKNFTTPYRVIIAYDTRQHSRFFAEEAAKVLAANEMEVLLMDEFRPTPLLSFGCRLKECHAGIMITASHNPPEYNGYKVYWSDGGQIVPPHDRGIIDEVNKIQDLSKIAVSEGVDHPLITMVSSEIEEAYLHSARSLQCYKEVNKNNGELLHIIYSNIHGTGITMVPSVLKAWGFNRVSYVEEQKDPDGGFPTVKYPNPEEPEALELGSKQLLAKKADIFLATDPDTDRVGVVVNHHGKAVRLNGNQVACLCLEHICSSLQSQGNLPEEAAFIKTVVTSLLFKRIAESYGKPCFEVLTGFKYIAELIQKWEENGSSFEFIFGGEESYGYLLGSDARDKDAVIACALISEVALHAKLRKWTLIDLLHEIYKKHGVYVEKLKSLRFPESKEGHLQMAKGMKKLFASPPTSLCGAEVIVIDNYLTSESKDVVSGTVSPIPLPKSEMISFKLSDESILHVRPSGTEPKLKIYCEVVTPYTQSKAIEEQLLLNEKYSDSLIQAVEDLFAY